MSDTERKKIYSQMRADLKLIEEYVIYTGELLRDCRSALQASPGYGPKLELINRIDQALGDDPNKEN